MLRITRKKNYSWRRALRLLLGDFLEVFSLGYWTLDRFQIIESHFPWLDSLRFLANDLIIVLSLGYFATNWPEEYYNVWDNQK